MFEYKAKAELKAPQGKKQLIRSKNPINEMLTVLIFIVSFEW